jgi:phage-related protein
MVEQSALKELVWSAPASATMWSFPERFRTLWDMRSTSRSRAGSIPAPSPSKASADEAELVESHEGDAYRAVYTVRFPSAIYVLHAFQKKSKRGIATPRLEMTTLKRRLREAEILHQARLSEKKGKR